MKNEILILRNIPRENPGIIENVLVENDLAYRVVDYDAAFSEPVEKFTGLIVLGGPESANDLSPKMVGELALIRKAVQSGLPCLGICLGLQTLVKALGGNVVKSKIKEVGFRDQDDQFFNVKLTREGRKDKLFDDLPDILPVFQLHGETVQITTGMELLATGDHCRNQIVKFGKWAYGIQSHFELTRSMLESWISADSDLRALDAEQLRSDFMAIEAGYNKTGRKLFTNFLTLSGIIKRGLRTISLL
jgi:GMP synthase (glutamine-hydrolysing)